MADPAKTYGIIFKATDQATGVIGKLGDSLSGLEAKALGISSGLGKFSGNLRDATEPMANLATGALKFEAGLLAAGAAVTVFAVKTAGDFDTAFRQITTLFDASGDDVAKFREAILAFASGSTKPLQDITNALQAAIGSGVEYSKSLDLLAVAEKLAVATRADLQGTTEVLVSTLNAYGMKTEDAGKLSDLFFQTIKDGKIEMDELSHSFAMVTPLAAASGVSVEEVGAAVATLTASGVPAGAAIEYLRSLLTNIVKPSSDAADMAEELGIKYDAAALKSKGLAGILQDIGKAVDGDTGKMSKLVGDVGGLVAALSLTGPQAERFVEILKNMGAATGATAAAFEKMVGSVDVSTARAMNAFRTMLVQIGTPMLDEFGGIANAIAKIFSSLGDSVKGGALKDVVAYIEGIAGDLEKTLATVATNLPTALAKADLSGFTRGIDAVRGAFSALFAGINLSTVDGLTKAVELAGAAFLGLSKFTAGVIESFKPLFDLLVKVGKEAGGINPEFFAMAGNIAGAAAQINLLAGGVAGLLPSIEALLNLMLLKQGIGLLGAFSGIAAALPALTMQLTAFGVAAATYFATDKVVSLVGALTQWQQATSHLAEAQRQGADIQRAAIPTLERFAETSGIAVKSIDEANDLVGKGVVVWDEATNGWVKADQALSGVGESITKVAEQTDQQKQAVLKNAEAMMAAADSAARMGAAQDKVASGIAGVRTIIDAATGKVIGYEQAVSSTGASSTAAGKSIDSAGESMGKSAKEADKAREAGAKMALEYEKIASNERIKTMEFKVKLDVARLEEDTKRIQAAFESINVGIESTGDVLGNLFGMFDKLGSLDSSAYRAVFDQIDKENTLRQQSFDLTKKLTEAQIENMKAQTQQLLKGDALIKIDAAGLEPALEMILWEVLKKVQVRANRDGLKMLLGV